MQGSKAVIEFLNEALTAELTAINHYFIQGKVCDDWGWSKLAAKYREESMDEMRDAETLIDRIILMDGIPNLQRLGTVTVGENVPEMLKLDNDLEAAAVEMYRRGIKICFEEGDPGTQEILDHIVLAEEAHLDWIETQLNVIDNIGVQMYLQSQI